MPRLPDVTDFGARPSLRTDRIDPVYPEGVEVAEAISNAALAFAEAYGQQQQKDSRIKYALAKNEIMAMMRSSAGTAIDSPRRTPRYSSPR
jgi:hypothetical protein